MDFTAIFRAIADFSSVDRSADKTSGKLKGMGGSAEEAGKKSDSFGSKVSKSMDDIGGKATKMGKKMSLGVTAPVVALGAFAVQSFTSFETSITAAGAKTEATAGQIEAMKKVALDMGASTKFSAGEAAGAMDTLAAAGFNANDVMGALPGVLLAAQASGEDLGLTADITAKAINAFNLKATDAAHVADVFATAANTSAIDMRGLGFALADAGQLGASANQDLEDVVAVVSRLVDLGVPAASAGTAIRQAIQSLQAPTKKSQKLISELGLNFRDMHGQILPLPDILKEIDRGLGDNNPKFEAAAEAAGLTNIAYRDLALNALFGVEGMKAVSLALSSGKPVVLDTQKDTEKLAQLQAGLAKTMGGPAAAAWIKAQTNQGKFVAGGAAAVKALGALNRASDGTSKKIGDIMSNTTAARLDQLKGSFETLAITILTEVAPALNKIAVKITDAVNSFAGFAKAHPLVAKILVVILALLAVVGPLLIAFGAIAAAIGAIAALGAPVILAILAIVAAIAALVIIGILIYKNWDKIKAFLIGVWNAIKNFAIKIWSSIAGFFVGLWKTITGAVVTAWNAVGAFLKGVWSAIVGFFKTIWGGITAAWSAIWNGIVSVVKGVWGVIVGYVRFQINLVKAIILAVANAILTAWKAFWGVFGGLLTSVWNLIVAVVRLGITLVKGVVLSVLIGMKTAVLAIWEALKAATIAVWNALVSAATAVWNALKGPIVAAVKFIKDVVVAVWNAIKAASVAVWNAIKNSTVAVWNAIKTAATTAWNAVKNAIKTAISAVWGVISGPLNTVKTKVAAVWSAIGTATRTAWDAVKKIVSDAVGKVGEIAGKVKDKVVGALKGAGTWLYDAGKKIVQGLIDGITGMIDNLTGAINKVTDKIAKFLPGSPVKTGPLTVLNNGYAGGQITKMIASGIKGGKAELVKAAANNIAKPVAMNARVAAVTAAQRKAALLANQKAIMARAAAIQAQRVKTMSSSAYINPRATAVEKNIEAQGQKNLTELHLTVNNPVGETTAQTMSKEVTRLAQLGVLG